MLLCIVAVASRRSVQEKPVMVAHGKTKRGDAEHAEEDAEMWQM